MKIKLKLMAKILWLCLLSTSFLLKSTVAAAIPAFTPGSALTNQPPSFTGTKGWAAHNFGVSNFMAITQLGVFDEGGDGLVNSHAVGVWSVGGMLLASTTIPAGTSAPLIGSYRYMPITPILIPAGLQVGSFVLIGAAYSVGDADDLVTPNSPTYANGISPSRLATGGVVYGFYGNGPGLPFPGNPYNAGSDIEFPVSSPFLEVNFQFETVVPEPSVPFLLAPSLFYLFFRQRKLR